MPSHKYQRASEDVKRELTDIMRGLKDPRITGMISVVSVDLTSDYSHCTVRVSSLESSGAAKEAVKGLRSAAGYIRREIGMRMRMRRTPEFHFEADDGIAYSAEIHQILRGLDLPAKGNTNEDSI
jgi:ribosome-binding factor A